MSSTLSSSSITFPVYKILPQRNSEKSLYANNRQQRTRGLIVSCGESGNPFSVEAPIAIVPPGTATLGALPGRWLVGSTSDSIHGNPKQSGLHFVNRMHAFRRNAARLDALVSLIKFLFAL